MNNEDKIKKLMQFSDEPSLAIFEELNAVREELASLNAEEIRKGDPGEKPTEEELLALIKPLIPKVENGKDGRTPMHVGKNPPLNPKIGDLWTKI